MGTFSNTWAPGMVQQGAKVLNPTPVGYELLKDSTGIAIRDSNGEFIYVLIS